LINAAGQYANKSHPQRHWFEWQLQLMHHIWLTMMRLAKPLPRPLVWPFNRWLHENLVRDLVVVKGRELRRRHRRFG